jgi:hypothetical protein
MAKNKIIYCRECRKRTVHSYVCKETAGDGTGIARVILAVSSFGISETLGAFKYWQCQKCGHLYKEF